MEHLSQLEQKTPVVTRREHKGRRDDKMAKRESLGSFTMRDKSWRTGSPEMYVWIYSYVTCIWSYFIKITVFLKGSYDAFLKIIILCICVVTEYVDML